MPVVTTIAIAPRYNSRGKRDATGAFLPEAKKFVEIAHGELHTFDNRARLVDRRKEVEQILRSYQAQKLPLSCVAFFCHGLERGLQTGHRIAHARDLASRIAAITNQAAIVPLYACDAASSRRDDAPGGDGGFADVLRDELCAAGAIHCRVDAHVTTGHTTWNPHVRRFNGGGSDVGGAGGHYIVPPGSKHWREWRRQLRRTRMRLLFPFMDDAAIHAHLAQGKAP